MYRPSGSRVKMEARIRYVPKEILFLQQKTGEDCNWGSAVIKRCYGLFG